MIVQIRGTSGSGKSWVMRQVMAQLKPWTPVYLPGKKRPRLYVNHQRAVVLGHYEAVCGGGDTIGSAKAIYAEINRVAAEIHPSAVLVESLLLSEDTKWSSQLPDLRVVFLTTPTETCLAQVSQRRAAVGNEKPLNPANTVNRVAVIERAREKLLAAGIYCRRASPNQAPSLILQWLRERE